MSVKQNRSEGAGAPASTYEISAAELRAERVMIGIPKVAPSTISDLYAKRAPYGGIIIGRTSTAEAEKRGRFDNPYHKFLGEFSLIVKRPTDGQIIEYRSNVAILPTAVEAAVLVQMRDNPEITVEFAFKIACEPHPTKPNLSMWTFSPLMAAKTPDRLGSLIAAVSESREQSATH